MRAWSSLWRNVINAYERVLTISHAVRMTYVYCYDRNLRNVNREKGGKGSKGMPENKFLANFVKGAFVCAKCDGNVCACLKSNYRLIVR